MLILLYFKVIDGSTRVDKKKTENQLQIIWFMDLLYWIHDTIHFENIPNIVTTIYIEKEM